MTRLTVATLGMCGLMVAVSSAQTQSELMVAEQLPDATAATVLQRDAGLHCGPLQIVPEVDSSFFHDSNPTYLAHGAKGVSGFRTEPILDVIVTGNDWNAYVRGWLAKDWYFGSVTNVKAVADQHYGENAGISFVTPQDTKLSVTERTVNFHFGRLRHKLGALNRPEAIAKGVSLGLVQLD